MADILAIEFFLTRLLMEGYIVVRFLIVVGKYKHTLH